MRTGWCLRRHLTYQASTKEVQISQSKEQHHKLLDTLKYWAYAHALRTESQSGLI